MSGYGHLSDEELRSIGRMRCLVPGCGRTHKVEPHIVATICGRHWRLGDKRRRVLHGAVHRKAKRVGWTQALLRLEGHLWTAVTSQAIERAMGL